MITAVSRNPTIFEVTSTGTNDGTVARNSGGKAIARGTATMKLNTTGNGVNNFDHQHDRFYRLDFSVIIVLYPLAIIRSATKSGDTKRTAKWRGVENVLVVIMAIVILLTTVANIIC